MLISSLQGEIPGKHPHQDTVRVISPMPDAVAFLDDIDSGVRTATVSEDHDFSNQCMISLSVKGVHLDLESPAQLVEFAEHSQQKNAPDARDRRSAPIGSSRMTIERLRTNKDLTKTCKGSAKQPAASRCAEMEVTRETKAFPPLPARLDTSSEDEEHMEWLTPDEGTTPTIDDAEQESKGTKRWRWKEKVWQILGIIKKQGDKSEELAAQSQKFFKGEDNCRNALIGSSKMTTSTMVQEILNVNITNKYGPDYSRSLMNYEPVRQCSRHSTQNETYIGHGQYVGTSDGKTPVPDGMC